MILKLWQIYFRDEQKKEIYPFAIPYKNETLTPYFENSTICNIIGGLENKDKLESYISICSWQLRKKRGDGATPIVLKNQTDLTEEKILKADWGLNSYALSTMKRAILSP